jgi:hypothetical protein
LQRAIFHVQLNLEAVFRASADEATVLVFDRGLIDGAAYWPDGAEAFFQDVACEMSAARDRYDAVLFLESAAQGGLAIDSDNTTRTERQTEAARLDSILYELWAPHPGFRFIAHTPTFEAKVQSALAALRALIAAG